MSKCKDCQHCEKRMQEPKVHTCRITGEVISPERLTTDANCVLYQENSWKFNRAKVMIEQLVDELNAQHQENSWKFNRAKMIIEQLVDELNAQLEETTELINMWEDSRVELNEMLESLEIPCRINDPDTCQYEEEDE